MQNLLPGRTPWETGQYAADHGASAAIAQGYQDMGRFLAGHGTGDAAILGLDRPAPPRIYTQPVTRGTDEERRARVDAWARRHGTTAGFDKATGQYRAVLEFGPVAYAVYTLTEQQVTERIAGRVAAIKDAAAGVLAAGKPSAA